MEPALDQPKPLPAIHRLDLKDIPTAVRLVAPDLGVLVVCAVCLGLCGRLTQEAPRSQRAQELVRATGRRDMCVLAGGVFLSSAPALSVGAGH